MKNQIDLIRRKQAYNFTKKVGETIQCLNCFDLFKKTKPAQMFCCECNSAEKKLIYYQKYK